MNDANRNHRSLWLTNAAGEPKLIARLGDPFDVGGGVTKTLLDFGLGAAGTSGGAGMASPERSASGAKLSSAFRSDTAKPVASLGPPCPPVPPAPPAGGSEWQRHHSGKRPDLHHRPGGRSFADWALANQPGANAQPDTDTDHDGQTDFVEYVFQSDPGQSGPPPQTAGRILIAGQE